MTINGTVDRNGYEFYAIVTESFDVNYIIYNRSTVNYEIYLKNGSARTNTGGWTFNAKVDGTNIYYQTNQQLKTNDVDFHTAKLIFSGSQYVYHNDDGNRTIVFSASLSKSSYYATDPGDCELSGSITLTTIPRSSTPTINTAGTNSPNFNIGDTITIYTNKKANFTHKLYFNYGSSSYLVGSDIVDSIQFDTSTKASDLYQLIPNASSYSNTFTLETYNGATLIGTETCNYTANVVNSNPTFNVAYQDSNATTTTITNNNQQIIQNNSTIQFNITNATALNNASLSSVSISINGVVQTQPISSSTLTFNYGTVNVAQNIDAIVTLTDSRGLTTTQNVLLTILAWSTPTAIITLNRKNNFYTETDIKVDANYSSLDSKNTITIKYRKKKTTDGSYGSYSNLSDNVTTTFNADNQYEWNIQVLVEDKIGSATYNLTLGVGLPIFFIDRRNRNVGVDCFPQSTNALEIQGQTQVNGDLIVDNVNILKSYATSETMIGYWITGKPLYRKVYTSFTTSGSSPPYYLIFEQDAHKHIVNSYGNITISTFELSLPTPDAGLGYVTGVAKNANNQIYLTTDTTRGVNAINCVIEYTKDTD